MDVKAKVLKVKTVCGSINANPFKFGIIVSKFNEFITQALLQGCLETLLKANANEANIVVYYCPGAFEIPYLANELAEMHQYDAIITLGCVIRGATAHFDYVAGQVASGVAGLALKHKVPIIFGVLTTETIEQAIERSGTKAGNKGCDAALAAIDMASLKHKLNNSIDE